MACPNRGGGAKSCRNVQCCPSQVQVMPVEANAEFWPPKSATLSPLNAIAAALHGWAPKLLACVQAAPSHSHVSPSVAAEVTPPNSTVRSRCCHTPSSDRPVRGESSRTLGSMPRRPIARCRTNGCSARRIRQRARSFVACRRRPLQKKNASAARCPRAASNCSRPSPKCRARHSIRRTAPSDFFVRRRP